MAEVTPRIVRAQPVNVRLAVLRLVSNGGEDKPAVYEQTDEVEEIGVRFTANLLCDIEEQYGSVAVWQQYTDLKPYSTVRDTFAMITGRPATEIGDALLQDEWYNYLAAIGEAFALANGVDPTRAAEEVAPFRARAQAIKDGKTLSEANASGDEPSDEPDDKPSSDTSATPGSTGSTPGPQPAATSTPSGD
jgi:hypothetical protein